MEKKDFFYTSNNAANPEEDKKTRTNLKNGICPRIFSEQEGSCCSGSLFSYFCNRQS